MAGVCMIAIGCTKEEPDTPQGVDPTISIEKVSATTNSITFRITPANGEKAAYLMVDGETPSAEDIVANGTSVSASASSEITIEKLNPGVKYNVVAAIYGNEKYVSSDLLTIETTNEDTPEQPDVDPQISIEELNSTSSSITFAITSSQAQECAYVMFNGSAPDAQSIIESGIEVDVNTTVSVTIRDLQSNTSYSVIAAASAGDKYVVSESLTITTKADAPENQGIEFEEVIDGRWYTGNNYYVGLSGIGGQILYLDIYSTTAATQNGTVLPTGTYYLDASGNGTLGYNDCTFQDSGSTTVERFQEGTLTVTTVGTKYRLDMNFILKNSGEQMIGYYEGKLPNVTDPVGDDPMESELIEILQVSSNAIKFRIKSEANRDWRCAVVEKPTYDISPSTPESFLVNYGFYGNGPTEFNWENGTEPVSGMIVTVAPGSEYVIMAGYYSYTSNSIQGDASVLVVRTSDAAESSETITVEIDKIESTRVEYTCIPSDGVFKYRTCVISRELVDEAQAGYASFGYSSFNAFMQYLIESSASQSQLFYEEASTSWGGLSSGTKYSICNLLYDNNNATRVEITDFSTL